MKQAACGIYGGVDEKKHITSQSTNVERGVFIAPAIQGPTERAAHKKRAIHDCDSPLADILSSRLFHTALKEPL